MSLLEVSRLSIRYPGQGEAAVSDASFAVEPGESVALAGRSGAGKTQTALAIMGLLPTEADASGTALLDGTDMIAASDEKRRRLRGSGVAMVFQDPSAALNPHLRIGEQLALVLREHGIARGRAASECVLDMLGRVGLPDPERQSRAYPWELSGGMRQRAMIAAGLIARPALLIADEPTTALDTTIQAQILALLERLRDELGIALLLITHDFGVIARAADRLVVMDRGRVVETGNVGAVFSAPAHAETTRMLEASRNRDLLVVGAGGDETTLDAADLSVVYHWRPVGRIWERHVLTAVESVDVRLATGETLAVVGESGSGKTSLARAILGLVTPATGRVVFLGRTLSPALGKRVKADLAGIQLVFQDPAGSLDPALRLSETLAEPLRVHRPELSAVERRDRILAALAAAGLDAGLAARYPHQLSGGQAQRAAIARALIVEPSVLVCDEAVASLDAPVRQDILELLARYQAERGLSILFISHDLGVVQRLAHRVAVMYAGRVIEQGTREAVFDRPHHPYTRALLDSVPSVDAPGRPALPLLTGEQPTSAGRAAGCAFHPRCRYAVDRCREEIPELRDIDGRAVACHRAGEPELG